MDEKRELKKEWARDRTGKESGRLKLEGKWEGCMGMNTEEKEDICWTEGKKEENALDGGGGGVKVVKSANE